MARRSVPWETLSPTFTDISRITPAKGEGTSIVALSDSSTIRGSSALMESPAFTSTSITGTSLKSPISGTSTFFVSGTLSFLIPLILQSRIAAAASIKTSAFAQSWGWD
jgi:hypothetical protein